MFVSLVVRGLAGNGVSRVVGVWGLAACGLVGGMSVGCVVQVFGAVGVKWPADYAKTLIT